MFARPRVHRALPLSAPLLRGLLLLLASMATALSMAGTLILKSPTEGAYLGQNNSIEFSITGARVQVTVTAKVTGPAGTTQVSQSFTPDADGKVSNSISLNFSEGTPTGDYTLTLSATEQSNTYEDQVVHVNVDVEKPRFYSVSPNSGAFVTGTVKIRASILEENVKDWRVKVNDQDIPNNTGTSNTVAVDWNASLIKTDGPQTITIVVRDQANNETTKTLNVTLDRIKPTISIVYPRTDTKLIPGTTINVTVDIVDASATSVDGSGIDVVARKTDGTYIELVARTSIAANGEKTLRWIGRIRYRAGVLPNQFKIVVNAIDRAGNRAAPQEVTLKFR